MAKYIDAEALIEGLKEHFDALYNDFDGKLLYSDHMCIGEDVDDLIDFVNKQPAADVAEVKHGEWIEGDYGELLGTDAPLSYKCSLCGEAHTDPWEFCPNCGALMKG